MPKLENSIQKILSDYTLTYLFQELRTDVITESDLRGFDSADEGPLAFVQYGRLRDDPTIDELHALYHVAKKGNADSINRFNNFPTEYSPNLSNNAIWGPSFEIGGGQHWRRQFTIELLLFFAQEFDRTVAREKAFTITDRAHFALDKLDTRNIPRSSFGESVSDIFIKESWWREGGGEGDWIWKCYITGEFVTYRNPIASIEYLNVPPELSAIPDQQVGVGDTLIVPLVITDYEAEQTITVQIDQSVSVATITHQENGGNHEMTIVGGLTPSSTTVTVTVSDGTDTTSENFVLTVE